MKLTLTQKIISMLGITTFTLILGGQIVQAETTVKPDKFNNEQDTIKQSLPDSIAVEGTSNSADFQQSTSASDLNIRSNNSQTLEITQGNFEVEPGTTTRSGSSYIGIGGNIGLSGDTTVGNGSFAVISKIGLTNYLSARPSALIEDDAVFLLPVTFDFSGDEVPNAEFSIAPYLGGGLAISTGRDDTVGALISGGLDIPLSSEFTANAGVNVSFIDDTDVGLLLGVGYNF
ncbi:MAG TPA: hypothetical protein V6C71_01555 [Coleofasciculaceae cyanobacterium]|jgi:hypothetical protein